MHQSWSNVEMTHWSHALSHARQRAMDDLVRRTREHKGIGVAGVKITRRLDDIRLYGPDQNPAYEREHHNLVIAVIGTGIKVRPGAPRAVVPTVQVLSLLDGRLANVGMGATDATIE